MFFTQEDYKKIEQWLSRNAIKDTEFNNSVLPLKGNEEVTIIQDGHNKKLLLKDLANNIKLLGDYDFINISESFNAKYISLQNAISLIPYRSRKIGQVITFLETNGNWSIYQFKGESLEVWNNTTLWVNVIESLHIDSILPDEEDLTITTPDVQGNVKMRFKDKDYNPLDFSGLGKVYLRKNIVTIIDTENNIAKDINLLTQQAFSKGNTIYIIQYDFDLNGAEITIPEGCVLDFQGGSFSNGTIKGNSTAIEAGINKIFNYNINITGTWNIECGYCEWFGYNNDGTHDCYDYINKAFSLNNYVRLLNKTYPISHKLVLSDYHKLIGYQGDATKIVPFGEFTDDCLISITSHNGYSKHGFLKDVGIYNSPTNGIICNGITQGFNIENVDIKYCNESGLVVTKCWYAAFRNINIWYNKIGISLVNKTIVENSGAVNGISFYNVWANHNSQHAVYINTHTNAINFNSCTFENCTDVAFLVENLYTNVSLLNCYFETNNTLFNVNSSYKIGNFSLISCYGVSHGAGYLGEIGDLNSFVMLDSSLYYGDAVTPEVSHCIKSNAAKNLLSGQISTKIPYIDTAGKILDLLGSKNDWNQKYENCDSPTWQTNVLNITHRGNYQYGCSAKDSLGFNRLSDTNSNYGIYRVERVLAEPDEEYRLNIIRNNKGTEEEVNCYKINRYGSITFNDIITTNIVLPHGDGFPSTNTGIRNGTTFFELGAKKMATYYGGKWYWMDGTVAKSY